MAFVPQTSNVFTGMTVKENLEMGAYLRDSGVEETMEQVFGLFPILAEKQNQMAGELSGGQRQQVAVGRALLQDPFWAQKIKEDRVDELADYDAKALATLY